MPLVVWITLSGLAMAAIALVGGVTLLLSEPALKRVLPPLVALAAGSLFGGARFFYVLPEGVDELGNDVGGYAALVT